MERTLIQKIFNENEEELTRIKRGEKIIIEAISRLTKKQFDELKKINIKIKITVSPS